MRRHIHGFINAVGVSASANQCQVRRHAERRTVVNDDEFRYLNQEPPPAALLAKIRKGDKGPKTSETEEFKVPGDSFGIARNRNIFLRPVPRPTFREGEMKELFPPELLPDEYLSPEVVRRLCSKFGRSSKEVVHAFRDAEGDVNRCVKALEVRHGAATPFGSYGLVALESYVPETFCLLALNLPSFEATRDPNVLDAIHELVLSAAEIPTDTPKKDLVEKMKTWTIEDGTLVQTILDEYDMTITEMILLPQGEYSSTGFYVMNPAGEEFPNIGTAAAATSLDLRTGIHSRFRFHVERIADSVSEHVVSERLHFGQSDVHLLRQAYWFNPEYSVEEYVRFKENLMQPSASVFEMRYASMFAPVTGIPGQRNIIELEKLKIAQHKYEKHYEDFTSPSKWITTDGNLQTVSSGFSNAPGVTLQKEINSQQSSESIHTTQTAPLSERLSKSMQRHGDRVFGRFYRDNFF